MIRSEIHEMLIKSEKQFKSEVGGEDKIPFLLANIASALWEIAAQLSDLNINIVRKP